MSQSTSSDATGKQRTVQIPSLLSNSLRVIFETFGASIIQLTAHGSVETTNTTTIDELRKFNLNREQQTQHRVSIDYEQIHSGEGILNELTSEAREEILSEVSAVLDSESIRVDPDLAVTSFTIRISDERLQEVTPAQTPEFDLRFVADPAEPAVREPTKRLNADRSLYRELGFNVTNLNLRSVVETKTKFTEQSDGRYMSWRGPEDVRPRSPERLAVRINKCVLPDSHGMLKPYTVIDDRVLEVPEDEIEQTGVPGKVGIENTRSSGDEK